MKNFLISCSFCKIIFTKTGIKSYLKRNKKIILYSTNNALNVKLKSYYKSKSCECIFRDQYCIKCEVVVGYYIRFPCISCIKNGNTNKFIFDCVSVDAEIRVIDDCEIIFR